MTSSLSRTQIFWLCLAQGSVLLPVFFALPLSFTFYWVAVAIWRFQIHRKALSFPGKLVKSSAALIGVLALFLSFTSFLSIETFVAFFLVSYSLKLVEVYEKKDGTFILSLSFIAIAAGFLFHQSLLVSFYALVSFCIIIQAWMSLYRLRKRAYFSEFKSAVSMLLFVLPIMVVLFLVMPRMGQLWHMPSQSKVGNTGFSNTMSPGTFSKLIQSDRVAFRVSFDNGIIPSPEQRYWRGLVLDGFDGARWSRQNAWRNLPRPSRSTAAPPKEWAIEELNNATELRYSVLIEPHLQRALFTLMAPTSASSNGLTLRFGNDATLKALTPVASRGKYLVSSQLSYRYQAPGLSTYEKRLNTQLPTQGNQQSRELGVSLRQRYGNGLDADRKIVSDVLSRFNEGFIYTLEPPLMPEDGIDTFLFDAQRGFCEHFSSAFVFVMRAAGIPARVVVGYQGGEYNREQDYLVVRQRDAHAWTELWLDGIGWQRFDPTAAVAPERIERGLSDALGASEIGLIGGIPSSVRWISWMQNRMEILNYQWQKAVINYDDNMQSTFFQRFLGGKDMWRVALFLFGAVGLVLLIYFVLIGATRRKPYSYTESEIYDKHLRQLAKKGFRKNEGETPLAFALRVAQKKPEWEPRLKEIATVYVRVAFGGERDQLERLRQICRSWRV